MREVFSSLIGNQYIRETMAPDLASGRAAHGYILSGPSGCGKRTAARLIAAASVCEHREDETHPLPCGACPNCRKILQDISADVLWISNGDKATISVDQIRQVRQSLYITPNDGERKFYIIENAHTMTTQAQNALLLSLEEPPSFVTFLLLTEDPASLLETIRSRAPVIHMELFRPEAVLEWLRKQKLPSSTLSNEERCTGAAMLSGGSLGQALMLLTEDEARRYYGEKLFEEIQKNLPQNAKIINKTFLHTLTDDGRINVTCEVECVEQIGEYKKISIGETN